MNGQSQSMPGVGHKHEFPKWAGVFLSALIALATVTVQWGVVSAKLDNVEKRLDEMIFEFRSLRQEASVMERRVSYLEGKNEGRK